jgi:hypothetical protein
MSTTRTGSVRRVGLDHFEPDDASDPHAQRKLRGQLEQIDYMAYAANKEMIGHAIGKADSAKVQRLAVAAASARAQWVSEALAMTESSHALSAEQVTRLARLRMTYDELTEAYEGLRRLVERGYLTYAAAPPT